MQATGHRWAGLSSEWAGRVFRACPCDGIALPMEDRYSQNLPPQVTVVGAGPAGIEVALHALHNLGVEHVTLVSRRAQARLPAVEPTEGYRCRWLTRENMLVRPTAIAAQRLLQQELENCYRTCNLPYPGWDALLHIDDYPAFLRDYLALTQQCPNHPLAHLVRPVMSFYAQVQDLLSVSDRTQLCQLIHRVKPLFATQSRPCADLLLSAIEKKRLKLAAGEFLSSCAIPTILRDDHTQWQPECVILATGLAQVAPLTALAEPTVSLLTGLRLKQQDKVTSCYQVAGTSLSSVHRRAATVASVIVQQRMNNDKALKRMTNENTPQLQPWQAE